jgi:hypothetical protein
MASSGKLARTFAQSLGIPEAAATTVMKALRTEKDMVSMRGRGSSAADMTTKDAAVFLTAILSGAVTSQLAEITNFLLDMPQVYAKVEGAPPQGLASLRQRTSGFFDPKKTMSLLDGLLALLDETWRAGDPIDENEPSYPIFDALTKPESVTFSLGMNGTKTGGFAVLKARAAPQLLVTRIYSSWKLKKDISPEDSPLHLFESKASFLTIAELNGEAINAAIVSLREPVPKTRNRAKRVARAGRR